MTTVIDSQVRQRQQLQPVTATGWRRGLGNLLRKEFGEWFGTRRWLVQLVIWLLLLNGVAAIIMSTEELEAGVTTAQRANMVTQTFLEMMAMTVGIGLIITVQGSIVGEKQLGTAAWVMSKPASRASFILAKAAANIVGIGLTAVIVPAIVFVMEMKWVGQLPLAIGPFLAGLAVISLSLLFYLTLTLMLGAIANSRGPVAAIPIGMLLAGLLVKGVLPQEILIFTPWLMSDVAVMLAQQQPLPDVWFVPITVTSVLIVVFTAVALWRFGREEF